jgi:hypothetical protein
VRWSSRSASLTTRASRPRGAAGVRDPQDVKLVGLIGLAGQQLPQCGQLQGRQALTAELGRRRRVLEPRRAAMRAAAPPLAPPPRPARGARRSAGRSDRAAEHGCSARRSARPLRPWLSYAGPWRRRMGPKDSSPTPSRVAAWSVLRVLLRGSDDPLDRRADAPRRTRSKASRSRSERRHRRIAPPRSGIYRSIVGAACAPSIARTE